MMRQLMKRAEQAAETRQRAAIERLAQTMRSVGHVEVERDGVRISGRGLVRRWLADAQLRFMADLVI